MLYNSHKTLNTGWIPLEAAAALEELEEYAPEPAVYTYLRARLSCIDFEILYELHYHMITLGKVGRIPFCLGSLMLTY